MKIAQCEKLAWSEKETAWKKNCLRVKKKMFIGLKGAFPKRVG
jgi:hypothetical protein